MKSLEKQNKKLFGSATLTSHNLITVENLKLYLIPYSNNPGSQKKKAENDPIPKIKNLDLLITHAPPLGILDTAQTSKHTGDLSILSFVQQNQPKIHLFGHIHQSYGTFQQSGTLFINCSSFKSSSSLNPPIIIDIHPNQKEVYIKM